MLTSESKLNVLILCCENARHIGTVEEHISSFLKYSKHKVWVLDSAVFSNFDFDLNLFDVIVFHYSIVIAMEAYLPSAFADRLARARGIKVLFVQDEFRWVDRTAEAAHRLGIKVLFTVVNEDVIRKIYYHPWFDDVRFERTLTGFVPANLVEIQVPDFEDRPIDVSYRARKLPGWCGSFALQKWQIAERFTKDAVRFGLKCDIATTEASRIYGDAWVKFISNSRAVLGTESGSSFVDFTGEIYQAVDDFEASHPDCSFREVAARFLEGRDGDITIRAISPRCFEAAALRTLMILYPGHYSGVLIPWRHYVPLRFDHSNMEEVVAVLRNPRHSREIIENAYREVACSKKWSFQGMVDHFDSVIEAVCRKLPTNGYYEHLQASPSKDGASADLRKRIVQQIDQEVESIRKQYERQLRTLNLKGKLVLLLQSARVKGSRLIHKIFPSFIAQGLIRGGEALLRKLKPIFSRVLLP